MARPQKYNWEAIEKAYIQGADIEDICKKYKIAKKTLQNKIYEFKWEIKGNINADVNEFKAVLGKVTEIALNNPETTDIYIAKLTTIVEDNEIIGNNRKLTKAFQGLIGKGLREGMYKTAQDIKSGVSALRDIETIANPQANKTDITVNNTNAIQNNTAIKTIDDIYGA